MPKSKPKSKVTRVKENKKNGSIQHKCVNCSYSTVNIQRYKNHEKTHSQSKPRQFPCQHPGCSYAAKDKYSLTRHSLIHSSEKPFSCPHPTCNYTTNRIDSLTAHTQLHSGQKPYKCPFDSCSFATATKSVLVVHSRTHTKERPYKCPEANCGYSAASTTALKGHKLTHPPKEGEAEQRPSFKCPLCEFSTKYKSNLSQHIKTHTLEKPFKCDEPNSNCTFATTKKSLLTNHKLKHSDEKPFACSFESCEYLCKSKGQLKSHLKIHSEERPYKCELCPFRGKIRGAVVNYLKEVHSDVRAFKCSAPECDYAAKTKYGLNNHLLVHKGEKKHSCSFSGCTYKTIWKHMIKRHESRNHSA